MKREEQQGQNQQKGSLSDESNPFANTNGPIDISDDDLPF